MSAPTSVPSFPADRVRDLRHKLRLSQKRLASELGISVSYLSQIESGGRPLTRRVLSILAVRYPGEWSAIDPSEDGALFVEAMTASTDPGVAHRVQDEQSARRAFRHHPDLARRMAALHDQLQRTQAQLRMIDDQLDTGASESGRLPWEQVRDWFHHHHNYIDSIDREAERIADTLIGQPHEALADRLRNEYGITVETLDPGGAALRHFDPERHVLSIDPVQPSETRLFALAHQLARCAFAEPIAAIAREGAASEAGRQLLAAGLANYAAGALLMPYARFREAARALRHDIDRLRQRFGTSFEQTCHRLSTLQRPGALGVPFFFCRVDMAGNITKRHSATGLQFARFGGACPLWVVHEAVAIPDRILVQLAETPDGVRYVSMAKGLVKPSGSYTRPPRRYAVALGCEISHADDFVYADRLGAGVAPDPIGTSCRICPRPDCEQRAFPPATSVVRIDPDQRGTVPYRFD
jgi:predicted transcriptional regulator/transcriptional regulator with XRE-family HTH domain